MAQVRFRDSLAALGPDRADICPGEPTHHMPCLSQRDKEDRQCAASEAGSISQQQFLYTAVSPHVAHGTFRPHRSQRAHLADSAGLLPKSQKEMPKLSRTEATCLQVSMGWRPGASRSRPGP